MNNNAPCEIDVARNMDVPNLNGTIIPANVLEKSLQDEYIQHHLKNHSLFAHIPQPGLEDAPFTRTVGDRVAIINSIGVEGSNLVANLTTLPDYSGSVPINRMIKEGFQPKINLRGLVTKDEKGNIESLKIISFDLCDGRPVKCDAD
jgi:hypothetical protein